jgi:hypothetical protein
VWAGFNEAPASQPPQAQSAPQPSARTPTPTPSTSSSPQLLPHLSEERYLELLDWTGRQIRADKRGHLSPELRPILERLALDVEALVDNVERYGSLFHRLAGTQRCLRDQAIASGRAWLKGHSGARRLYAGTG